MSEIIRLNYGGTVFQTRKETLEKVPFFTELLKDPKNKDDTGVYFVDGTAKYFEPILTFLRRGYLFLDRSMNPQGVWEEANFLDILDMKCGRYACKELDIHERVKHLQLLYHCKDECDRKKTKTRLWNDE